MRHLTSAIVGIAGFTLLTAAPQAFAASSGGGPALSTPSAAGAVSNTEFSVCGTTVRPSIEDASTPNEFKSYLGIWIGNWSNGRICSGLVIKKVDGSGDAFLDYIYRGAGKSAPANSQSVIGRIENRETLTFNDKDGSRYTVKLQPGDELPATFLSTAGTRLETLFRKTSASTASARGSDEQQIRAFLKDFFAHGGVAPRADSDLGKLFRENDAINKRTGDMPMSADTNACQCEDPSQARYSIRDIEFIGDTKAAVALYEAVYGGERKEIRLTVRKEGDQWRIHDMVVKGPAGGLSLQLEKLNKDLLKLADAGTKTTGAASPEHARPDAQDCFMGECFKQFIVSKHYEGQTTVAEVRTERYNVPAGILQSPAPPPKTEKYIVACGSPGYIQQSGGFRVKEPAPDPPHSTRSAKQLWEAVCGAVTADPPMAVNSPAPKPFETDDPLIRDLIADVGRPVWFLLSGGIYIDPRGLSRASGAIIAPQKLGPCGSLSEAKSIEFSYAPSSAWLAARVVQEMIGKGFEKGREGTYKSTDALSHLGLQGCIHTGNFMATYFVYDLGKFILTDAKLINEFTAPDRKTGANTKIRSYRATAAFQASPRIAAMFGRNVLGSVGWTVAWSMNPITTKWEVYQIADAAWSR